MYRKFKYVYNAANKNFYTKIFLKFLFKLSIEKFSIQTFYTKSCLKIYCFTTLCELEIRFRTLYIEKSTKCKQTEYTEIKVYFLSWIFQDQNPVFNTCTKKCLKVSKGHY